jgi:hypothetical protein|tara:strand:+ start:62 stop:232 length:171 start_codon:yes stop_codon:yes gene_type:complete
MQIIETDHHIIEFETKKDKKIMMQECEKLGVNLDYYLFEFDCTEEVEEWDPQSDTY